MEKPDYFLFCFVFNHQFSTFYTYGFNRTLWILLLVMQLRISHSVEREFETLPWIILYFVEGP